MRRAAPAAHAAAAPVTPVAPAAAPLAGAVEARPRRRAPAISERVRDAARAAGEAARATVGRRGAERRADGAGRRSRRRATARADDLKRIKGVGPKLEGVLHDLGDLPLRPDRGLGAGRRSPGSTRTSTGFHGRVERDDWVAQAKVLAAGGETEHSRGSTAARRPERTARNGTKGRGGLRAAEGRRRMLADKDRIFTNIYGMFDRSLAGRGRAGIGTIPPGSSPWAATRSSRR